MQMYDVYTLQNQYSWRVVLSIWGPLHLGDYDHPVVLLAALRGCTPGKNGSKIAILILLASEASYFDPNLTQLQLTQLSSGTSEKSGSIPELS